MKIYIKYDNSCESPREEDVLGVMLCNHRTYYLGDASNPEAGRHGTFKADFEAYLKSINKTLNDVIYTPIYMLDHSGISLSSKPFSCPWDSGQIGWHFVFKSTIRSEYTVKRITKNLKEKVINILNNELETYNQYQQGHCYGFEIYDDNDESQDNLIDSCWGFIGKLDEVKQQMYQHLDHSLVAQLTKLDYKDIIY